MKVSELIEELSKCNPDANVECEIDGEDNWLCSCFLSVEEDELNPIVIISGSMFG